MLYYDEGWKYEIKGKKGLIVEGERGMVKAPSVWNRCNTRSFTTGHSC
jgi:hypothetical protein